MSAALAWDGLGSAGAMGIERGDRTLDIWDRMCHNGTTMHFGIGLGGFP